MTGEIDTSETSHARAETDRTRREELSVAGLAVITEACIDVKDRACVDVCPVDAFREGPNFLVIDPNDCIDCAVCVPECPVSAIYAEEDVPSDQRDFTPLNAELALVWKPITRTKPALPDADTWSTVQDKRDQLER